MLSLWLLLDIFLSHLRWVSSVLHHVMWICRLCPTLAGSCRPYLGAIELLWIGVGIATLKFSFNICDNKNIFVSGVSTGKGRKLHSVQALFIFRKVDKNTPLASRKAIQLSSETYEQKLSDLQRGRWKPYISDIDILLFVSSALPCERDSSLQMFWIPIYYKPKVSLALSLTSL